MQETERKKLFSQIPAVGDAVHWTEFQEFSTTLPRKLLTEAIGNCAQRLREDLKKGREPDLSRPAFSKQVVAELKRLASPRLKPVINATGIIVHTNLGRSVLAQKAADAVYAAARGYSNLEYDLEKHKRGSRHSHASKLLARMTGAQAAIAVNNNAAAVLLALNALAEGREVIVSRGELVEIGGSFRVPDVIAKSGCKMVEVGTTNKTHENDYINAITENTALLLKVHTSNYRIMGFSQNVSGAKLAGIAKEKGIFSMEDLGSGLITMPEILRSGDEPTVEMAVKTGVDVITFSGDKLLGGPQAGILTGSSKIIDRIAKNPLARAVRCDKMTITALEAVCRLYMDPAAALAEIPTLAMIDKSRAEVRKKCEALAKKLIDKAGDFAKIEVADVLSQAGGGSLPLLDIPSAAVSIKPLKMSVNKFEDKLHEADVPIIGRIADDRCLLDLRTVLDGQDKILQNEICEILTREAF